MNKCLLFFILLTILIIETIQQINQPANVAIKQDPFQQFNNAIKRNLQQEKTLDPNSIEYEMSERLKTQIAIWTSIGLAFVLYFSVMAIINMPNPKSSILYAKYDTTRGGNEL